MSEPGRSNDSNDSIDRVRAAVLLALHDHEAGLDALGCVCQACVELLPVNGASISVMIGPRNRETLYTSNDVISRMEASQFGLGEGPSYEAFATHRPILVADLASASTSSWPVFASEIATEPIGAIFAFPLISGAISVGALTLYGERPRWLSSTELSTALQLVDIATSALLSLRWGRDNAEGWLDLPRNREQVHQATGMLIAAFGLSAEHALARLRGYSFGAGRLLEDVAHDLVTRRLTPADLDRP